MNSNERFDRSRRQPIPFWVLVVVAAFGLVYLASLTLVYVEGDDAASIVYHATAHHTGIAPYSPYHSMMDFVLNLLPTNEALLRTVSIGLTSIAAVCSVVLILMLAFDWFGESQIRGKWLVALVIMLAMP